MSVCCGLQSVVFVSFCKVASSDEQIKEVTVVWGMREAECHVTRRVVNRIRGEVDHRKDGLCDR